MTNAILTPSSPPTNIAAWLDAVLHNPAARPLGGDASARQYFRVRADGKTYIAMQSPPSEKPAQFVAVQSFLSANKIRVPNLVCHDAERGFMLLEDFGDHTYLSAANKNNCDNLYAAAIRTLVDMQTLSPPAALIPHYDETLLRDEMLLYPTWYCEHYMQQPLDKTARQTFTRAAEWLGRQCLAQPQVFVHRDYHSRNLMAMDDGVGVLDFQDAVIGSAAYDIVSLLRDAYVLWDDEQQQQWLRQYRRLATAANVSHSDDESLWRDFNIVGAQRGLKVLGIFARLWMRDGKDSYLRDMPRVYSHLLTACAATSELAELELLIRRLPPPCAS